MLSENGAERSRKLAISVLACCKGNHIMIKCTCLMTFAAKFLFCVLVSSIGCVSYFCFSAFRSDKDPVFSNENATRKLSCC